MSPRRKALIAVVVMASLSGGVMQAWLGEPSPFVTPIAAAVVFGFGLPCAVMPWRHAGRLALVLALAAFAFGAAQMHYAMNSCYSDGCIGLVILAVMMLPIGLVNAVVAFFRRGS